MINIQRILGLPFFIELCSPSLGPFGMSVPPMGKWSLASVRGPVTLVAAGWSFVYFNVEKEGEEKTLWGS